MHNLSKKPLSKQRLREKKPPAKGRTSWEEEPEFEEWPDFVA